MVETDQETGEILFVFGTHLIDQLFRADAHLFSFQHDGCAVGIVSAHIGALLASRLLEAHPDIRLDSFQQVAEVQRTVGVGKGAGYENLAG